MRILKLTTLEAFEFAINIRKPHIKYICVENFFMNRSIPYQMNTMTVYPTQLLIGLLAICRRYWVQIECMDTKNERRVFKKSL